MNIQDWASEIGYYNEAAKDHVRLLVYGESGAGKTTFAGTFPSPFVLDSDKGGRTLKDKTIPFLPLHRGDRVFEICSNVLLKLEKKESPFDELKVETLVFDSLTSLADMLMVEAMRYPAPGHSPKDPNRVKPEWDHYSMIQNRMKHLMKYAQDLGLNVVGTAGIKLERDEVLGSFVGKPNIIGGYRDLIAHDFDEVYYLDCEEQSGEKPPKYVAHTTKYRYFEAKSRDGIKDRVEDPTYLKLYGGNA